MGMIMIGGGLEWNEIILVAGVVGISTMVVLLKVMM